MKSLPFNTAIAIAFTLDSKTFNGMATLGTDSNPKDPNQRPKPPRQLSPSLGVAPPAAPAPRSMSLPPPVQESPPPETESIELLADVSRQRFPPWLVSMFLHITLILGLAFIPIIEKVSQPFTIFGTAGEELDTVPFELSNLKSEKLQESAAPDAPQVEVSDFSLLDIPEPVVSPVGVGLEVKAIQPELGFGGRHGTLKSTLLAAFGGTPGTENAVRDGLAWLARQQRNDGGWSLEGPYAQGAIQENRIAATAMALIAFAGAGHTHREGEYRDRVDRGLKFLLRKINSDGFFADEAPGRQQMYSQAQATIALSELFGMTNDQDLRQPVQRALDFAEQSQSPRGGWRYIPREDGDTSVTGWFVMALMSGRMSGLSTDDRVLQRVHEFLDSVQSNNGTRYSYTPLSNRNPSYSMTAEGLLCREYLGWRRDDSRLVQGCEQLLDQLITVEPRDRSFYYWYYATQTLHHFGGEPWSRWNAAMREALPALQVAQGREKGSWSPESDEHSSPGGRLYSTCFAIYCLEVYYRHLPIYGISGLARPK